MNFNNFLIEFKKDKCKSDQVYDFFIHMISTNKLRPNEPLPSIRSLAKHNNISKSHVERAYGNLVCDGYIVARPKSGYFIADDIEDFVVLEKPILENNTENDYVNLIEIEDKYKMSLLLDLLDELNELMRHNAYSILNEYEQYYSMLQSAVAKYLMQSKAVDVDASRIIVFDNLQDAFFYLKDVLLKDKALYMSPTDEIEFHNYLCRAQIKTELLLNILKSEIIAVQSYWQFPNGIPMDEDKKVSLVNWAKSNDYNYIIELNRFNSYRFQTVVSSHIVNLVPNNVFYVEDLSELFYNNIRFAFIVLPANFNQVIQLPKLSNFKIAYLSQLMSSRNFYIFMNKVWISDREKLKIITEKLDSLNIKYNTPMVGGYITIITEGLSKVLLSKLVSCIRRETSKNLFVHENNLVCIYSNIDKEKILDFLKCIY